MFRIVFSLIIGVMLIFSCSEEPTEPQGAVDPEIISVRIDSLWNLNAPDSNLVEIKVSDPQGFTDLKNVTLKVFDNFNQQIFLDSLYDDGGLNGTTDLIAGDGVFRNLFNPKTVTGSSEGEYTFNFSVEDKAGNKSGELNQKVTFAYNRPPVINSISAPSQLLSGAEAGFIFVMVADQDGDTKTTQVNLDLFQNDQSVLAQPINLFNDGNTAENGDIFANDSIFSLKIDSSFAAGRLGDYKMKFVAEDEFGDKSMEFVKDIFIENKVGQILKVSLPDSLNRPGQEGEFTESLFTVSVHEPQGLTDIASVYFDLIFPDGPANNNPFIMVDNGLPYNFDNLFVEAGDKEPNDGVYSLTFLVNDDNQIGTYHFSFFVRDKVGNLTAAYQDSIEVQ